MGVTIPFQMHYQAAISNLLRAVKCIFSNTLRAVGCSPPLGTAPRMRNDGVLSGGALPQVLRMK
jgi:hypothetical protein